MKAIVLAAGEGRRMGGLTKTTNKCLLPVCGEKSSLDLQIDALRGVGFDDRDITVVVGHFFDKIRERYPNLNHRFAENYDVFNNLHSLHSVRREMDEGFLLLNGDIVIVNMQTALSCVMNSTTVNLLVERKECDEEDMKVYILHPSRDCPTGKLYRIGKDIVPEYSYGEYIGITYFPSIGGMAMSRALEVLKNEGKSWSAWYESAFQYMADMGVLISIHSLDTNYCPWQEIDTPEDLEKAKKLFNG